MKVLFYIFLLLPLFTLSQVNGEVIDGDTNDPVFGAKIIASTGEKVLSDIDGKFKISSSSFPITIIISAQTYVTDTIEIIEAGDFTIKLYPPTLDVKTVVVTAGRRDQEIEDVTISMEIIKLDVVDNKGLVDLEQAVDMSPGVYTMDGQVSIRGGSGFAYGAGSRVLLLWNGVPILSGDAGDAKFNAIPLESASQIEILKGASSVLYGSGALNGIISLTEREPGLKAETRIKLQTGIYSNPRRKSLKWWSTNPIFYQGDAYYGKMYKKVGFTMAVNGYSNPGYKEAEKETRGRVSGTVFFKLNKKKKIKAGIGYNLQFQNAGYFLIWENDSLGYTPSGGADTSNAESTVTYIDGIRFSMDPYIKMYDKNNNLHSVKTRYYFIQNKNLTNTTQSANSSVLYGDYQFQHKWSQGSVITTGVTAIRTDVMSNLFGDHNSQNGAIYGQFDHSLNKLDLTGGVRVEYFEQDGFRGDSDFYFNADSTSKIPVYPIFRIGSHYKLAKFTHLRASIGQGIRYPSAAERYTKTSVGALNVFPNPLLTPERGWAAEIGIKQVVKIGKNWKGIIDVAGFVNQYENMMEFTFGFFNPINNERLNTSAPDFNDQVINIIGQGYLLEQMIGFSAENSENARISGIEFSFNSQGKIGEVELTSLIGYTYMNPVTLNDNPDYLKTFSTFEDTTIINGTDSTYSYTYDNTLKYRFNHLVKLDIEAKWKNYSLGVSLRYNSYMKNIDAVFEDEIISGVYILPGLKEYRKEYDSGVAVVDVRMGYEFKKHYRLGLMVNNIFNTEYSSRPGDIQPPQTIMMQIQMKF